MTRESVLAVAKPILFNTDMVRAIQDGTKLVTRRIVKSNKVDVNKCAFVEMSMNPSELRIDKNGMEYPHDLKGLYATFEQTYGEYYPPVKAPCQVDDILYVRETWAITSRILTEMSPNGMTWSPEGVGQKRYIYKAGFSHRDSPGINCWRPSIHMPKEAARIFLRATNVRVERLQDITDEQVLLEGVPEDEDYPLDTPIYCPKCKGKGLISAFHSVSLGYMEADCPYCDTLKKRYSNLWDSIMKKSDLAKYGWAANPWVWVIEFERLEITE